MESRNNNQVPQEQAWHLLQSKLNELQAELDKLKQPDYIPQPGEVVEVSDDGESWHRRIFVEYKYKKFFCIGNLVEADYKNGIHTDLNRWRFCRRLSGEIIEFGCDKPKDYTHLLPEGYEFCTEEQAEFLLKVKLIGLPEESPVGDICYFPDNFVERHKRFYRPIRRIQYHVAVHEAVTAEPNPYAVDWSNAPEWAELHAWDEGGMSFWYGTIIEKMIWRSCSKPSGFTLPEGLDWRQSKTRRSM